MTLRMCSLQFPTGNFLANSKLADNLFFQDHRGLAMGVTKYLTSTVVRDKNTFWVDITESKQPNTLWDIVPYEQPAGGE